MESLLVLKAGIINIKTPVPGSLKPPVATSVNRYTHLISSLPCSNTLTC